MPLPWGALLRAAALGTVVLGVLLLASAVLGGGAPSLVSAGAEGPSAAVLQHDLGRPLPAGDGHDGQQFYAVARAMPHPSAAVPALDRPAYRLQRPLFPALAWLVHPGATGDALITSLVLVGLLGVFVGCLATGALAVTLGAGPRWAIAFAALPGTWAALRLGLADNLALGLAAAAVVLHLRGRRGWAVLAAVAAVLTKEPVLLVLVPMALQGRSRRQLSLVAVPAAVAGALALALRWWLPPSGAQVTELVTPLSGLRTVLPAWWAGQDTAAGLLLLAALVLGAWAVLQPGGWAPLRLVVALHVVFVLSLSPDVVGLSFNVTRATAPLLWAALLLVATRRPQAGPAAHRVAVDGEEPALSPLP